MKTLSTLLLIACLIPVFLLSAQDRQPDWDSENPPNATRYPTEHRLVFFAVLEGLYEDGVTGEALDLLIPNEEGMWVNDQP